MPSAWWRKGMTGDEAEFEQFYCNTSEEVDDTQGGEPGQGQGPSKRPRREWPNGGSKHELLRYYRERHSVCRTQLGVPAEFLAKIWEFRKLHPELESVGDKRKREAEPDEDQIIVDVTGNRTFDLIDKPRVRIDEPSLLATAEGGMEALPDTPTPVPVVPADAPKGDGVGAGDDAGAEGGVEAGGDAGSGDGGGAGMEAGEAIEGCGGWASEEDYYDDDL